ncbi:antibiotic biosynthesis monooxygenase [Aquimarina atlantica]|uniref:Antibiotic biosynthesis monooxygenase n=1 Tax=Aquimarina atlantica TaxID=1317122 RepID=A0A023BVY5_9FLAO|nr:antibiotic biosynthesis monooxygenase [Aquimarina atlantica]EZH74084.1 antibiotic biosynthesis monooxygenase [Aquimarina atlantica]
METNCEVILKSEVKNSMVNNLMNFLDENLPNVRGFKGCLSVKILFNKETNEMVFYEEWISKNHHTDYIAFISNNGIMAKLAAFLTKAPEINYYHKLAI